MVLTEIQTQRSREQNNEPGNKPCFHAQLIYDKVNNNKKRTAFSINHVEKTGQLHAKKKKRKKERKKLHHFLIPYTKKKQKQKQNKTKKKLQNRIKA